MSTRKPTAPIYWILKYPSIPKEQPIEEELVIFSSTDKYSKYLKKLLTERDDLEFVEIARYETFQAAINQANKCEGKVLSEAEINI